MNIYTKGMYTKETASVSDLDHRILYNLFIILWVFAMEIIRASHSLTSNLLFHAAVIVENGETEVAC